MGRSKKTWTDERRKKLHDLYPDTANREIAKILDMSESAVEVQARRDGLRKSPEYMRVRSKAGWFKPGLVPSNKGRKISEYCPPEALERMRRTQFKRGNTPANQKPLGSERVFSGYVEVKVSMSGKRACERWVPKQRVIWEQHHGPIPQGCIVVFKDGNKRNFDIDNLELRNRSQHCKNNIGSLPDEYKAILQLKGALQRQLNKLKNKKDG